MVSNLKNNLSFLRNIFYLQKHHLILIVIFAFSFIINMHFRFLKQFILDYVIFIYMKIILFIKLIVRFINFLITILFFFYL